MGSKGDLSGFDRGVDGARQAALVISGAAGIFPHNISSERQF